MTERFDLHLNDKTLAAPASKPAGTDGLEQPGIATVGFKKYPWS